MTNFDVKAGDLLLVYWEDVEEDSSWRSLEKIQDEKLPLAKSVGWLLNIDDRAMRILPSIIKSGDETAAGSAKIPIGCIVKVEILKHDDLDVIVDIESESPIPGPCEPI
jgi:hypothetical protein